LIADTTNISMIASRLPSGIGTVDSGLEISHTNAWQRLSS